MTEASERPTDSLRKEQDEPRGRQIDAGELGAQVSRLWGDSFAESCEVTVRLADDAADSSWETMSRSGIGIRHGRERTVFA